MSETSVWLGAANKMVRKTTRISRARENQSLINPVRRLSFCLAVLPIIFLLSVLRFVDRQTLPLEIIKNKFAGLRGCYQMKTLWERETACSMSKCNRSNRLTCPACLVPQWASISAGDRQQPLKPPRLLPNPQIVRSVRG